MVSLQDIFLISTGISKVAFGQGVCPNLQDLHIERSPDLVEVGTLPNSLLELHLWYCPRLEKIEGLCGLGNLKTLEIKYCPKVEELSGLRTLRSLERLRLVKCGVSGILDLQQLTKLRVLKVLNCQALEELAGIEDLMLRLRALDISGCHNLRRGEDLRQRAENYPNDDGSERSVRGLNWDRCKCRH